MDKEKEPQRSIEEQITDLLVAVTGLKLKVSNLQDKVEKLENTNANPMITFDDAIASMEQIGNTLYVAAGKKLYELGIKDKSNG